MGCVRSGDTRQRRRWRTQDTLSQARWEEKEARLSAAEPPPFGKQVKAGSGTRQPRPPTSAVVPTPARLLVTYAVWSIVWAVACGPHGVFYHLWINAWSSSSLQKVGESGERLWSRERCVWRVSG